MKRKLVGLLLVLVLLLVVGMGARRADASPAEAKEGQAPTTVILDGVSYPIDALAGFDEAQELHIVVDGPTFSEGIIYAFSTLKGADDYLAQAGLEAEPVVAQEDDILSPTTRATNCDRPNRHLKAYQHSDLRGDVLCLNRPGWIPHMRNVRGHNWNDRVSSLVRVSSVNTGMTTRFWEHDDFIGATLTIIRTYRIDHLSHLGWNDRASSVKVW